MVQSVLGFMVHKMLMIQLKSAIFSFDTKSTLRKVKSWTHPSDLDELVAADRMHSTCSAWDGVGRWARVAVAGVDNDTVAWDPCVDRTLAEADIDRMVMSCLEGIKHFFFVIEKCFLRVLLLGMFSDTYRVRAVFDLPAAAYLSKPTTACRTWAALAWVAAILRTPR